MDGSMVDQATDVDEDSAGRSGWQVANPPSRERRVVWIGYSAIGSSWTFFRDALEESVGAAVSIPARRIEDLLSKPGEERVVPVDVEHFGPEGERGVECCGDIGMVAVVDRPT